MKKMNREMKRRNLTMEQLEDRQLLAVTAGLAAFLPAPTGNTIVVDAVADPANWRTTSAVELRQAIDDAADGDTITFDSKLDGKTITLRASNGSLEINKSIYIDASNLSKGITISGNNSVRVFVIGSGASVELKGLTVTKGNTSSISGEDADGGGILNNGTLTIVDSVITGNLSGNRGGGLANHGTLTATNTIISANETALYGGAMDGRGGSNATFYNCTIAGNIARDVVGALNMAGHATLYNSIITQNVCENNPSYNENDGDVTMVSSLLDAASVFVTEPVFEKAFDTATGTERYVLKNANSLDLSLAKGSAAIDNGDNQYVSVSKDIAGNQRIFKSYSSQETAIVDIGAYEYQGTIVFYDSIVVTTAADTVNDSDGVISLREAVRDIASGGMITFDASLSGQTITLTQGEISVAKSVTIDASDLVGGITVSGNNASRIFNVASGTNVTISHMKLTNGNTSGDGGAIYNSGNLTILYSVLKGNYAGNRGGAFGNVGTVTVVNSEISANKCALYGGAFDTRTGSSVTLYNCTVAGNIALDEGGAVNAAGTLTLYNTIVSCNFAPNGQPNISGAINGAAYITADPSFTVGPVFANNELVNADALDLTLSSTSYAALDAGNNDYVDASIDLLGNERIVKAFAFNESAIVDLGAYEYQETVHYDPPTIIVTTNLDVIDANDGVISLREAIRDIGFAGTIKFDSSLDGSRIVLGENGALILSQQMTIDASDLANGITIDGNNACRVITNEDGSNATLIHLTITGGWTPDYDPNVGGVYFAGGGILNLAKMKIVDCVISANRSGDIGGGVANLYGSMTIENCDIYGNNSYYGGGVGTDFYASTTIKNSRILNNIAGSGGGIRVHRGSITVENTVIKGNTALTYNGGGFYANYEAKAYFFGCEISANTCGLNGGGIDIRPDSSATITNCTISGNSAIDAVGGLNCPGTLTMNNTIVAGNYSAQIPDFDGSYAGANNLIEGNAGFAVAPVFENGVLVNADALDLGLAEGSVAIDAGNNDLVTVATDLRGNPRIVNAVVDLGAIEFQSGFTPVALDAPTISTVESAGANRHSVAWNGVEYATAYEVAYSVDQEVWTSVQAADVSCVVTGLTYGDLVYYKVKALGDGVSYSDSDWSEAKSLYVCPMDINGDKIISGADLTILSKAWFARPTSANWDARADVDGSGMVNGSDLTWLSTNWLKRATSAELSYPPEKAEAFATTDFAEDALELDFVTLD